MFRTRKKAVALVSALAAVVLIASGCSSSSDNKSGGSSTTLKVRLFGTFGYKEAGLFDQYQKLHPNIKIDYTTVEQEATYWTALQTSLSSGAGLGDVQIVDTSCGRREFNAHGHQRAECGLDLCYGQQPGMAVDERLKPIFVMLFCGKG